MFVYLGLFLFVFLGFLCYSGEGFRVVDIEAHQAVKEYVAEWPTKK